MFNQEEFRKFIESKCSTNYKSKKNIELINAICQFDLPIYKYLNIQVEGCSKRIKRNFNNLTKKPSNVSINYYLLYLFGYKLCPRCLIIYSINFFTTNINSWNNLSSICKKCTKKYDKKYYQDNIDYYTEYRKNNKKYIANYCKNYRKINKDIIYNKNKKWVNNNPEKVASYQKKWRTNNPEKVKAQWAKKRANKLKATPSWLTRQDYIEIEDMYWQAGEYERLLNEKFHVDHIIPLQGNGVCGLHVPWNLQVLSAKENLIKSNKWTSDGKWNTSDP